MEGRRTGRELIHRLNLVWQVPVAFIFDLSESMDDGKKAKPYPYSKEEAEEILEAEMTSDAHVSPQEHARLKRIAGYE